MANYPTAGLLATEVPEPETSTAFEVAREDGTWASGFAVEHRRAAGPAVTGRHGDGEIPGRGEFAADPRQPLAA